MSTSRSAPPIHPLARTGCSSSQGSASGGPPQAGLRCLMFVLTVAVLAAAVGASPALEGALVTDFRQGANNETNGTVTGLGNLHWINSIIQASNSTYYEGMGVPQRTIFTGPVRRLLLTPVLVAEPAALGGR